MPTRNMPIWCRNDHPLRITNQESSVGDGEVERQDRVYVHAQQPLALVISVGSETRRDEPRFIDVNDRQSARIGSSCRVRQTAPEESVRVTDRTHGTADGKWAGRSRDRVVLWETEIGDVA